MPAISITYPPDGDTLDFSKKIKIQWDSDHTEPVKSWKFYLGSEDGRWDILMCELGALKQIHLDPDELPRGGRLFAQVTGVYDGKGKDPEDNDKEVVMEERVLSNTVQWICPAPESLVSNHALKEEAFQHTRV